MHRTGTVTVEIVGFNFEINSTTEIHDKYKRSPPLRLVNKITAGQHTINRMKCSCADSYDRRVEKRARMSLSYKPFYTNYEYNFTNKRDLERQKNVTHQNYIYIRNR